LSNSCPTNWHSTLEFCYLKLFNLGYAEAVQICHANNGYLRNPSTQNRKMVNASLSDDLRSGDSHSYSHSFHICVKPMGRDSLGTCFKENTLFVEDSLPVPMSLEQCFQSCKATSTCKFFTWNVNTESCGLRFFEPGFLINAPTQRTGTRDAIVSAENKVFVGQTFNTPSRNSCQKACQTDFRCFSVTFNDENTLNPNVCTLNFGPTVRELSLPGETGISSSPKFCPH